MAILIYRRCLNVKKLFVVQSTCCLGGSINEWQLRFVTVIFNFGDTKCVKSFKKLALVVAGMGLSCAALADPVGLWKTYDLYNPSIATSLVKVTFENGAYVGRLQKVIRTGATSNVCLVSHCKGAYAGKDLTGVPVIWGFKPAGSNQYAGGVAYDIQNDKKYSATITESGNKLILTAGFKIMGKVVGKSTSWVRAN